MTPPFFLVVFAGYYIIAARPGTSTAGTRHDFLSPGRSKIFTCVNVLLRTDEERRPVHVTPAPALSSLPTF
jgi:hypothetical protein